MLLVSMVTAERSEPCVWRYASAVSKPDWAVKEPLLHQMGFVFVSMCVCVFINDGLCSFYIMNVCVNTSWFNFLAGWSMFLWVCVIVAFCSPVFTASFVGSLFRHLGCECIPTFQTISLRMGSRPAHKRATSQSFLEMRLNSSFLGWPKLLFDTQNTRIKPDELKKRKMERLNCFTWNCRCMCAYVQLFDAVPFKVVSKLSTLFIYQ